jgi:hypothetical protein
MDFAEGAPGSLSEPEPAAAIAKRFFADVFTVDHTLTVHGRGLIERLPALLEALRMAGIKTFDVRLHANTLEDVFLSLTGRRLRE